MAFFANSSEENHSSTPSKQMILLLSASELTGELLELLTQNPHICIGVTKSFQSFFTSKELRSIHWSGIILDFSTYKQLTAQDKELLYSLAQGYPTRILRKTPAGVIRCTHPADQRDCDLSSFLDSCRNSEHARPIRRQQRYEFSTNVKIQCIAPAQWEETPVTDTVQDEERSTTLNISVGGAYILTNRDYCVGDIVSLSIPILGEENAVRSEVRWVKNGATEFSGHGGIGVHFTAMSTGQEQSLQSLFKEI